MSVKTDDVLHNAYEAALKRVAEVAPTLGSTLVDSISKEEWKSWDASNEKALVADTADIDSADELDNDQPVAA